MKQFSKQQIFWIGWFVFFVINILQAAFLELHFDEAYYWLYSRNLDWGYFDHPPLVAVLIFAGTKLFGGYLGVRFFFVSLASEFIENDLTSDYEKQDCEQKHSCAWLQSSNITLPACPFVFWGTGFTPTIPSLTFVRKITGCLSSPSRTGT